MRNCLPALACALLAVCQPLAAQTVPEDLSAAVDIPPEDWRAMAAGRTITYRIDGAFWAMERYASEGNGVTLQFQNGECTQGTWEYAEPLYCFHWDDLGTSCFRHTQIGERIVVIETSDGTETGSVQDVSDISQIPLVCDRARVS